VTKKPEKSAAVIVGGFVQAEGPNIKTRQGNLVLDESRRARKED
jgi:hypothetical protein